MRVFITYTLDEGPRFRLAAKSWERRGWEVRIAYPGKRVPKGSRVVPSNWINFAFKRGRLKASNFGRRGWDSAPVVKFPKTATEIEILTCGRAI